MGGAAERQLDGRQVTVNEARPMTERNNRPGFDRGNSRPNRSEEAPASNEGMDQAA